jgi:hypothetical protein
MDALSFIAVIVLIVAATTIRHYLAVANSKASRERSLLRRATRAAKTSQMASQACVRLSNASSELSHASTVFLAAAREARSEDRVFQFVCLYLYGKLQFYRAGCLLGRAMQFSQRADAKLRESKAIMSLVKHDA